MYVIHTLTHQHPHFFKSTIHYREAYSAKDRVVEITLKTNSSIEELDKLLCVEQEKEKEKERDADEAEKVRNREQKLRQINCT